MRRSLDSSERHLLIGIYFRGLVLHHKSCVALLYKQVNLSPQPYTLLCPCTDDITTEQQ